MTIFIHLLPANNTIIIKTAAALSITVLLSVMLVFISVPAYGKKKLVPEI